MEMAEQMAFLNTRRQKEIEVLTRPPCIACCAYTILYLGHLLLACDFTMLHLEQPLQSHILSCCLL